MFFFLCLFIIDKMKVNDNFLVTEVLDDQDLFNFE